MLVYRLLTFYFTFLVELVSVGHSKLTSRRVWIPLVLLVLGCIALAPSKMTKKVVEPMASTTRTIISPLAMPLNSLSTRIRERVEHPELMDGDQDALTRLVFQKDREILAQQAEIARLKREVAALQNLRKRLPGMSHVLRRARVIGRSTGVTSPAILIDLGLHDDLLIGNPAVDSDSLIGKVVQVGPTTSSIEPITIKGNRINGVLVPAILEAGTPLAGQLAQFVVTSMDQLEADVSEKVSVNVGDLARLNDRQWVPSAQGMVIGRVVDIQKIPEDLLLKKVIIRPL